MKDQHTSICNLGIAVWNFFSSLFLFMFSSPLFYFLFSLFYTKALFGLLQVARKGATGK